jgi:hypothetical protein
MLSGMTGSGPKADLRCYLQAGREALLWKLDGLSEYDVRRPTVAHWDQPAGGWFSVIAFNLIRRPPGGPDTPSNQTEAATSPASAVPSPPCKEFSNGLPDPVIGGPSV